MYCHHSGSGCNMFYQPDRYFSQELVEGRNGSLGSEILKRFNMFIDFPLR